MPDESSTIAYIGLGSNVGERQDQLEQAIIALHRTEGIKVALCSSIYETDPVGYIDQPAFLNMVCAVQVTVSPEELLRACLGIEQALGRVRLIRWGPRTVDLDVLLYGDEEYAGEELIVPHPRMKERLFVLVPLLEILPRSSRYFALLAEAMETMEGKEGVLLWKKTNWQSEFGRFES